MLFRSTTRARIRRIAAGAFAAALLTAAMTAGGAQAAPATHAVCSTVITLYLTPGFSATPRASSVTSKGETGTVLCTGTVAGRRITGPGTLAVEEITQADCLSDHSSGTVSATLPTSAGPLHIAGPFTGRRLGLVESVEIGFPQGHFSGVGPVVPTRGDCLISPITQALTAITGTLNG